MMLLNQLLKADTKLFLYLNSLHGPTLDSFMLFLSNSFIPAIFILLFFSFITLRKWKKHAPIIFLFLALTIGSADFISSQLFKPYYKRLRPCKNPEISSQVYYTGHKCWGGKYGFVSSHAANSFAFVCFLSLVLSTKYFVLNTGLFFYAFLVSYSRIYLAKHYPLDILGGAMLGILLAFIYGFFWKLWSKKYNLTSL